MSYLDSYPTLKDLPVADLTLSALNPRHTVDPDSISALAASIRVCGLMQNLAGLVMGDDCTMIVAGGRRLRALQQLRAAGEGPETVPVLLTDDIAQARAWAMAENAARSDLNPADEIGAYAAMARAGERVPQIAAAFGVTELQVQRRLKLATLNDAQLTALRDGRINLSQAAALLLCSTEGQHADYLRCAEDGWDADRMRRTILHERVTGQDRRAKFVGLDTYRAAGGALTRDLFSSEVVIEDTALLDRLFQEAVDARREEFIADGWRWAEFDDSTYIATWDLGKNYTRIWPKATPLTAQQEEDLDDLTARKVTHKLSAVEQATLSEIERLLKPDFTAAQRAVAGVVFCVRHDGSLDFEQGYIRAEDQAEAIAADILRDTSPSKNATSTPDSPEDGAGLSAAVRADLRAIHLSALQEAILAQPALTRLLLAYGLATSDGRPFDVSISEQPNAPKITDGWQQAPVLDHDGRTITNWDHAQHMSLDDLTLAIANRLIRGMIYGLSFSAARPEWHQLIEDAGADMRARWRPTKANFFSRVTAPYLDALFCHLFDLTADHADARDFAKMKKGEKANLMHMLFDPDGSRKAYRLMTDTALARIEAWTPENY